MVVERSLGLMTTAALALTAVLVALGVVTAARLHRDVDELDRQADVQTKVMVVAATLLDLEARRRDFLLAPEPSTLEPYRTSLAEIDLQLARLESATGEQAHGQGELGPLHRLIEARHAELALWLDGAATRGLEGGTTGAAQEESSPRSEDIYRSLRQLAEQAAASLAQRRTARSDTIARNEGAMIAATAALTLLLAALLAAVRRERALHSRMRTAEANVRQGLERRVSDSGAELETAVGRLAISEERLRRVFDGVIEGILTTDESQVIVEANPASARMFGCKVGDLIGTSLDRLIPVRHRAGHRLSVEAFGTGEGSARPMRSSGGRRHVMALRFDGEEFPIEASISRVDVDGRHFYTVVHRDLTEQLGTAAALSDSRQLLAATFDAASIAMAQIDPSTRRFVAVNDALCSLSGFTREELLSMGPDHLNHPDDRLDVRKLDALLNGEASYRLEKRLVRKDGRVVWVEVSGSVVHDPEGRPLRLIGIVQDVTARREAEAALRGRERHQAFLVRLNDCLRGLDDPQAIAYEAARLLGDFAQVDRVAYAEDDGNGETITVARNYTRGVPGIEGRHRYLDCGEQLMAELRSGSTAVRRDVASDPSLSDAEKSAYAALRLGAAVCVPLMQDGRLHALLLAGTTGARDWSADEVTLFEDVAQRVRADFGRAAAQAAERSASAKLGAALDSMNDSVLITDAQGRFVEFNDAFVAFHRLRSRDECPRELSGYLALVEVFMADGAPAPIERWPVTRALLGEAASSVEFRLRRKDTDETWVVSYSFAPIRSGDGRITGAVVSGRDITRIKRTQEALATSRAALRHLIANQQRAQEDERMRISRELHDDLQQSLAAIRMDALAVAERTAAGHTDVGPLLARIDRLSGAAISSTRRIVADLRPELLEELGLRSALEALCAEHTQRFGAECRFTVSAGGAAVPLEDPLLSVGLFRIAQEALNNVARHAEATVVTVHLDATDNGLVLLRITDNGVGIHQQDNPKPTSFGLLGMAERVRSLGGQLRIDSSVGRGTVVEALVPILPPSDADDLMGLAGPPAPGEWPIPLRTPDVLEAWGQPLQAIVEALDCRVAVLDRWGVIQMVNRAWRETPDARAPGPLAGGGPGVDFLDVCQRIAAEEPSMSRVSEGLAAVLEGQADSCTVNVPSDSPAGRCRFRMHAASIIGGLTIVSQVVLDGPGEDAEADGSSRGLQPR